MQKNSYILVCSLMTATYFSWNMLLFVNLLWMYIVFHGGYWFYSYTEDTTWTNQKWTQTFLGEYQLQKHCLHNKQHFRVIKTWKKKRFVIWSHNKNRWLPRKQLAQGSQHVTVRGLEADDVQDREKWHLGGQINVGISSTCKFCEYVGARGTLRDLMVTSRNLRKYFSFIWGRENNRINFQVTCMLLERWNLKVHVVIPE